MEEFDSPTYFGAWLKRRRRVLDITQSELARRAGCSLPALRKIESGERRPSKQLAGLLGRSLEIPVEEQITFIKVARGELPVERLNPEALVSYSGTRLSSNAQIIPENLPEMPTPFIGREPELTALGQLLADPQCRLLTLAGPGGIGKTRLSIEVAARQKKLFPDGVWFASLAPLTSAELIVPAIAEAINFRFQDPSQQPAQLQHYLHEQKALLVLDNVEHLLDGVGVFAELLQNAHQVKFLVTSRERMNLLSEWVFEIQGLPVPPNDQVESFEAYSSVALFLQCARRIRAGFELQAGDRQWVRHICQMMDGMPLGIELAASWVALLSCEEISKEIRRNLDFLSVSMRDLPERHRSLRASLDHSWKLLNTEEKLALRRLSVFAGNFRLEAAKEVGGTSLAVLSSLKEKSLLRRTGQEYFNLHEFIRQYAGLKLAEDPDEENRIRDQHAFYYAQRLSHWEKALKGSLQVATLNEMAHKIDNIRQAWQRMICNYPSNAPNENRISIDLLHRSLFSLSLFYELRCRNEEAIGLLADTVDCMKATRRAFFQDEDCCDIDAILGHVTAYLGLHYYYVQQIFKARECLEEAIHLMGDRPYRIEKSQAQVILASVYSKQGLLAKSSELLEQSRDVFRELSDHWWYHLSLIHLANAYMMSGKIQESQKLYQEILQWVEPGDLRLGLPVRNGIAYIKYLLTDYPGAEQALQENLKASFQLGFDRQTASIYQYLGQVALATHQIELAERYLQKSIDLLSRYGTSYDLALGLLFTGKCLAARLEIKAAREKFKQVIKIGRMLPAYYVVHWGATNLARMEMKEGRVEKALEVALVLQRNPVEVKQALDDSQDLVTELQTLLPESKFRTVMNQTEGKRIEALLDLF